jgi:hypothetical protein
MELPNTFCKGSSFLFSYDHTHKFRHRIHAVQFNLLLEQATKTSTQAIQWIWPVPILIGVLFAPESPWYVLGLCISLALLIIIEQQVARPSWQNRRCEEGTTELDLSKERRRIIQRRRHNRYDGHYK